MSKRISILPDEDAYQQVRNARLAVKAILERYWSQITKGSKGIHPLGHFMACSDLQVSGQYGQEAQEIARCLIHTSVLEASFRIGEIYTQKLPKKLRSKYGVYFTPPALTARLLDNVEQAGFDWGQGRIVDPACGGGAFLAPIALRMKRALKNRGLSDSATLLHIASHLRGKELDPFSAWMSQVFLEIALYDELAATEMDLPVIIDVGDTLTSVKEERYDLVVGNPPYSRIKLADDMRERYARSLYGHANLYGLFTDRALAMLNDGGILAYVTPTSFLSGQYFKALRHLLSIESMPVCIDFIESRKGVFADVLQETVLAVFAKHHRHQAGISSTLRVLGESDIEVASNGEFNIVEDSDGPWLIPRNPLHSQLLAQALNNHATLYEYGYKVSTGPLVWNRHKEQIVANKTKTTLPLLWGECVSKDGGFIHKSEKKHHEPWFRIEGAKDNWLVVTEPCLLLQRTTAKEQASRLIGAIVPEDFIQAHGGVVIENHLNMIKPFLGNEPPIRVDTLQFILKSSLVDTLFRMMNGSVAVSAYELEALPLPPLEKAIEIQRALVDGIAHDSIQTMIRDAYSERITEAA